MHRFLISTICFYDAVGGVALTKIELYRSLTSPYSAQSEGKNATRIGDGSFYAFLLSLGDVESEPRILSRRGFYFLAKNKLGYERRIHFSKAGIKKWRIAAKMVRALSFLPYTRMIAVTGSLSMNTATAASDIDLLVVSKNDRIWTTRALVTAVMHVIRKRRHGSFISDRICLNHYISEADMTLVPKNLFSAHIFLSLIPIWGYSSTKSELARRNQLWTSNYFNNGRKQNMNLREFISGSKVSTAKKILEKMIPNPTQDIIELLLKKAQSKKIKRSIKTSHIKENDIIFNDSALVFHHPRPKNQEAIFLYGKNLKEYLPKTSDNYSH
ncbi:MAG: hypothetical protein A3B96_02240 [Candidatus Spechtbacteria bacterium RIFCSPHIGHO2_02_FULL_43_15b]|nr:MAG: hypothetical protein A3B96_02240 [Candidatus Spechtbacteria bacterium RIFCSPHIGHO2_02_FULL_43_15b]